MKPFKHATLADTEWPVPYHWVEVSPDVFQGPEGLLRLWADDGFLIDPGRCRSANSVRPAEWSLVRTLNGVCITGRYTESETLVVTYAVRAASVHGQEWLLPEVQAAYVVRNSSPDLLAALRAAVEVRPVLTSELGELDHLGHAAMGPVPVYGTWRPHGDLVDNANLSSVPPTEAFLTLIGGGWLDFSDQPHCCGLILQPLPWKRIHAARIDTMVAALSRDGATGSTSLGARVWGYELSSDGFSYECRDDSGRPVAIGAVWPDPFAQIWHLRYWLDAAHATELEEAFVRARLS